MKPLGAILAAVLGTVLAAGPCMAQVSAPGVPRAGPPLQSMHPAADRNAARNAAGTSATVTGAVGTTGAGNVGGGGIHYSTAPLSTAATPAAPVTGIDGTKIGRIGSGPGSIGGPARSRSGINGTGLQSRR